MNNLLTLEEVKKYLEVEQQELEKYISNGKLHAYKIGGTYLRFRKEEVLNLRYQIVPSVSRRVAKPTFFSRVADFWRFNNFYIVSIVFVVVLAVYMIRGE